MVKVPHRVSNLDDGKQRWTDTPVSCTAAGNRGSYIIGRNALVGECKARLGMGAAIWPAEALGAGS